MEVNLSDSDFNKNAFEKEENKFEAEENKYDISISPISSYSKEKTLSPSTSVYCESVCASCYKTVNIREARCSILESYQYNDITNNEKWVTKMNITVTYHKKCFRSTEAAKKVSYNKNIFNKLCENIINNEHNRFTIDDIKMMIYEISNDIIDIFSDEELEHMLLNSFMGNITIMNMYKTKIFTFNKN